MAESKTKGFVSPAYSSDKGDKPPAAPARDSGKKVQSPYYNTKGGTEGHGK